MRVPHEGGGRELLDQREEDSSASTAGVFRDWEGGGGGAVSIVNSWESFAEAGRSNCELQQYIDSREGCIHVSMKMIGGRWTFSLLTRLCLAGCIRSCILYN